MERLLPVIGLQPDALHLWLDFAMAILADPTAWTIAQSLGAGHRTDHSR